MTGALTSSTKGLSSFISKVSALSALTAGGFGLSSLISGAVAGGESVYQLSTKMGITSAEAASLNKVLKLTGGDAQSFAAAMTKLDKTYTSSGEAGDKTRGVLDAFGVTLTDSAGKLLPLNQQLAELSKGYKLAAANGVEQEYIMSTLGVKGLSLVQTLKDYDEATTLASKSKGVGIDPKQMHELDQQMKIVSMQAGSLGTAFTGALAPVAQQVFPPLMSGLSATASLLAEHKQLIGSTITTLLGLTVAYKGIGAVTAIIAGIGTAWNIASAQAIAAATATTESTSILTLAQERQISKMVSNSNREYARMEAAAIKTATTAAGSTAEAAAVITAEMVRISEAAMLAANKIRTDMTAAFLASAETSTATTAVVVGGFAEQAAAATGSGVKTVAAAEASTTATASTIVVQGELAASHVVAGNSAVLQGEKTVGAMAVARVATGNMLSSLWALAGGWIGIGVATAFAISKLIDYIDTKDQVESYDPKAQVYDDTSRPGKHTKKITVDNIVSPDDPNEFGFGGSEGIGYASRGGTTEVRTPLSDAEEEEHGKWVAWKKKQAEQKPWNNTTDPDLLAKIQAAVGGAGTGGGSGRDNVGSSATDSATKAYENLKNKADQTSKSIKDEWISLTGTQIDALDNWKSKELESLEESKSANANYDNDLARLDQIYAEKKKKIEADQQRDTNRIWDSAKADAQEYQNKLAEIGLTGVDKQKFDIDTSATDQIDKIINKYRDLKADYENGTKEQQEQFRNAWTASGIQFEITENGMVNFQKQTAANQVIIEKEKKQKIKDLHYERTKYQEDLDQAYNDGDLAKYKELLDSKQALLAQDLKGQQAMADLYKTVWSDAHMSMTAVMANVGVGAYDGLKEGISGMLDGTKSIGDAWNSLGSSVGNVIRDMATQWIASRLMMAIFGKTTMSTETAASIAAGVATATAWAPAAAMVSLASFGANSAPAMAGIAATTALSSGLAIAGFATGGAVYGPGTGTSDSIMAMLSHGEYVLKASAVKALGIDTLNTLNTGKMPAFATGGLVTGRSLSSVGQGRYDSTNNAVNNKNNAKSSARSSGGNQLNGVTLNVSAIDGKSFERFLSTSGGAKIQKFFAKQASAFAAT